MKRMVAKYTLEIMWIVVLILLFWTAPPAAQSDDRWWDFGIGLCPGGGIDCEEPPEPPVG